MFLHIHTRANLTSIMGSNKSGKETVIHETRMDIWQPHSLCTAAGEGPSPANARALQGTS